MRRILSATLLCLVTGGGAAHAAVPALAECDRAVAVAPGDISSYRCFVLAARSGHVTFDAAAGRLEAILARDPGKAQARLALAFVRDSQASPEAEAEFGSAIDLFQRAGDAAGETLARTALASWLMRHGRAGDGGPELDRAAEAASRAGDDASPARVDIARAGLAYRQLDYGRALRLLDNAQTAALSATDWDLRSSWLGARGMVFWALGRHAEARAAYLDQAQLLRQAGDRYGEAVARVNIVLLTTDPAEKKARAFETIEVARAAGHRGVESAAYFYLAEASTGREALEYARRSLELSRDADTIDQQGRSARAYALALLPFDRVEAFHVIDEAAATARSRGDPNEAVRDLFVRARMQWNGGRRDDAVADSLRLLDAIEALRDFQPEDTVRAQRFAQWRNAYYALANHLLAGDLGDETDQAGQAADRELAFRAVERMRARLLIDRLDAAQARVPAADSEARRKRAGLLTQVAALNRRLLDPRLDAVTRVQVVDELEQAERAVAEASAALARVDPRYAAVMSPALATLADVRSALAPGEAFVSFQVSDNWQGGARPDGAWAWVVSPSAEAAVRLPDRLNPDLAIAPFLGLIARRDGSDAPAAATLYDALLADVLARVPADTTRLVIVPDGTLNRLPFGALRAQAGAAPLATQYDISVVPSASVWLRWRRTVQQVGPGSALSLADPDLAVPVGTSGDGGLRSVAAGLGALPHARREATLLARSAGSRSVVLVGADASEARVKSERLDAFGLLHFAAHTVVDDEHPERTAMVLAPGDGQQDGLLTVREVIDLRLARQVVLLSACESASGALVPGEGMLGLAHAFFQAGASAVVASLWPVADAEEARVFDGVARRFAAGERLVTAVTGAQRDAIAAGLPTAAWAGLVVMGDGSAIPVPGGTRTWPRWWLVSAAGCLALAALGAWVVRRQS